MPKQAKEKEDVKDVTRKKRKSSKQPGGGNPDRKKEDEAERKRRSKRHCMGDVGICNLPGQGHRESDGESGGGSDDEEEGKAEDSEIEVNKVQMVETLPSQSLDVLFPNRWNLEVYKWDLETGQKLDKHNLVWDLSTHGTQTRVWVPATLRCDVYGIK